MSGNTKLRFFLAFLLITVSCSSCAWTKSNAQWSYKKRALEEKVLQNPNDYNVNYALGVAYAMRGERFSVPDSWKKFFFRKTILYLKEAIRIKPESAEAHLALGEVLGNKRINDSLGAIRHTVISKKLFERQNNTEGVTLAEENMQVLSKKFFSFYLLGFSDIQIPEPSQPSPPVLPLIANAPPQVK